ncbi:MAG: hypothetical protein CME36_09740 [unclassified Hahellaceae]|nr:hypothetical protein [Hahellaceae bacterium]|tara:strand:+ start:28080 stop:28643 length:564 start_codon:yes stop_codon:yes gene_type:complete
MNNFKALSIAGLLVGSMSAQAGVITFPESVSFDINADPMTFSIPFTGDPREGFSNGINVPTVIYTLENDIYYSRYDEVDYSDGTINFGLRTMFAAQVPFSVAEAVGKETIMGPLLDQVYTYTVWFNYHELIPCDTWYGLCAEGASGTVNESVQVSFFDGSAQEVPVGPTLPLLAAGLAGLWLRRKQS